MDAWAEQRIATKEVGVASVAPDIRARAMKKLAAKLATQARKYAADTPVVSRSEISKTNLAKLRPALNRQRQTLMTAEPLLGLMGTYSGKPVEPVISNEVVGSVPNAVAISQPSKPMVRFRQKLSELVAGTGTVPLTILHIGQAAGGTFLFDQSLRTALQKQFGNAGHGMIAPARDLLQNQTAAYEITKAGRWRSETNRLRSKHGFGLSTMRAASRSSLSSMTVTSHNGPFDWVGVTIATGPSQGTFTLKVGEVERKFDAHAEQQGSRFFKLNVQGDSATVQPGGGAQTAILNWSMGRNQPGVRHVHFGLLSDRPNEMRRFDANLIASDLRSLSPDLIMIDGVSRDSDAIREFSDLVAQIRAAAPRADVVQLGAGSDQLAGHQTCLNFSSNGKAKASVVDVEQINGVASWHWAPSRADVCAIEDQLQQGLVGVDAANLTPDFAERRAAAFVKWLADPAAKSSDVALLKPAQ
jgi:hypothetical protein